MCNAWNHPKDCQCGWGGIGHKGRKAAYYSGITPENWCFPGIPPIICSLQSFTIPNARCPVCGSSVFYYQNTNGSSVFFDELGPPWPKHHCTDNSRSFTPLPQTASHHTIRDSWRSAGWIFYYVSHAENVDNDIVKLFVRSSEDGESVSVFLLKDAHYRKRLMELLEPRIVCYLKSYIGSKMLLSVFSKNGIQSEYVAYPSLSEARENIYQKIQKMDKANKQKVQILAPKTTSLNKISAVSPHHNKPKIKKTKKDKKSNVKTEGNKKENKNNIPSQTPENRIMALALENAKNKKKSQT